MNVLNPQVEKTGTTPSKQELYVLVRSMKKGGTPEERAAIIAELGRQGDPRAVEPLLECLKDADSMVRRSAIEALSRLSSTRSVDALVDRFKDRNEDWLSRIYAAEALGRIGSTAATAALKDVALDRGEDTLTRIHAMDVLYRYKQNEAVEVLMKCLRDGDRRIRRAAARTLGGR